MDDTPSQQRAVASSDVNELILASYKAAQSGIARHTTDVTSTRNWVVVGLGEKRGHDTK
jgi:hypothetical protein